MLSHQMSLPKTSAEMIAMEKYLQFQDAVPCKIRAKRGCATHPRSIAERVGLHPILTNTDQYSFVFSFRAIEDHVAEYNTWFCR